jgi:hypothetical protein
VDGNHGWLLTQPDAFCEVTTNLAPLEPATSLDADQGEAVA